MLPIRKQKSVSRAFARSIRLQNIFPKFGKKIARLIFRRIINKSFGKSVNFLISGGSYIPERTLKILNAIGYPLANGYSMSKLGIVSCQLSAKPKVRLTGSVGKPFGSYETKIENNILFVKSQSSCSYLLNMDGKKAEVANNWFNTLDIASVDKKGNYYINGREDDVIICSNGEKINPDIIEKKLNFSTLINFSILNINNQIALILQIRPKVTYFNLQQIDKELNNNLKACRKNNIFIQSIYYTDQPIRSDKSVKVSRKLLIDKIKNNEVKLYPISQLHDKIKNLSTNDINKEIVNKVKKIIAIVLNKNLNDLSIDKDIIIDYGATSLDYLTILVQLQNEFGLDIVSNNNNMRSINQMATYIIANERRV
ncbi:MAG: AMP-binding protein [Mycoplasmoidaceae bacterium]|nr:AMP-binding protein [Mycoplasmoidaceae bacterium]